MHLTVSIAAPARRPHLGRPRRDPGRAEAARLKKAGQTVLDGGQAHQAPGAPERTLRLSVVRPGWCPNRTVIGAAAESGSIVPNRTQSYLPCLRPDRTVTGAAAESGAIVPAAPAPGPRRHRCGDRIRSHRA